MSATMPEGRSLSYSIMLHAGLILIALVGLPTLFSRDHELQPLVMTVDILPISAMTNVKPSDQPVQKQQEAPTVKNEKPIPPTVKEQPKPAEEPPHFDPNAGKAEPLPKDIPKPEPKKEEAKKPDTFAALMNKLNAEEKANPKTPPKDQASAKENTTQSTAPYDASLPLSISEKDAIRNQFIKCWRMPIGAKDPASLIVRVKVQLNPDGTLISKSLATDQLARYNSDSFFRAAADGALRAVDQCTQPPLGPLQNLPADKYGSWRDMELNFDPSQLLY